MDKTRTPHLHHLNIIRLGRLMDMMYKPTELAAEIGVNVDTIYRSYMPAGLPHSIDDHGNFWIHGLAFITWARDTIVKRKSKRKGIPDGTAWCMRCNQPVEIKTPTEKRINRKLRLLQSHCPYCSTIVNRITQTPSPKFVLSACPERSRREVEGSHLGEGRDGGRP